MLVALPILEVWLLIQVGQPDRALADRGHPGAPRGRWAAWLMRHEGRRAWKALTDAYATGKVPTGSWPTRR